VNIAEAAHIIGFSENGPRGEGELSEELAQDVANLMLLCGICHTTIDRNKENYPVERLRRMKRAHERWVERVVSIGRERESHILLYGANVGDHSSAVSYRAAAPALIADGRYPASSVPIELSTIHGSFRDRTEQFWQVESEHLRRAVRERVLEPLAMRSISHLSVFALAPQPLLTLLGYLLGDINYEAQVYQLHREPPGWSWQEHPDGFEYVVHEPNGARGQPALVLALSATITDDRIHAVLGDDAAIWRITVPEPNNDFLKSLRQLQQFRQMMRPLLDRIKATHGQKALLHVFPAAPVSIAVELGRVIMPKADMPLRIYDQNNDRGGFVHALDTGTTQGGSND